jgi:hypothetical protein
MEFKRGDEESFGDRKKSNLVRLSLSDFNKDKLINVKLIKLTLYADFRTLGDGNTGANLKECTVNHLSKDRS